MLEGFVQMLRGMAGIVAALVTLLPCTGLAQVKGSADTVIPRKNLIDEYVFGRMQKDGISHAALATDAEFLRRVYLDLTGRIPEPETVRAFLKDTDPNKRDKIIDSLFPAMPTMCVGRRPTRVGPFLDRWTYFFSDMFRNNEQLNEGIATFH